MTDRLNNYLVSRELGNRVITTRRRKSNDNCTTQREEIERRIRSIDLSNTTQIKSQHYAPINHLDIDISEFRYLLSCGADGFIFIYDLLNNDKSNNINTIVSLTKISHPRRNDNLAKGVSTVQWYPFDTGMFFSGSIDGYVEVWDTNEEKVSRSFELDGSVQAIAMSPISSGSLLIAAATVSQKVRLCDIRTSSSTHCLAGHKESVLCLQWAPYSPHIIATGSKDKTIRLWDIRKSDTCIMALDQHNESTTIINNTNSNGNGNGSGGSGGGGLQEFSGMKSHSTRKYFKQIRPNELTQNSPNMAAKDAPFAHNGAVTSLVWSKDGQALISTGNDSKIRRWDMFTGTNTFIDFPSAINPCKMGNQIALSYDSNYLLHPNGKTLNMYNARTGQLIRYLRGHFERVNCCIFHPNQELLISGSNDKQILVWDTSMSDSSSLINDSNPFSLPLNNLSSSNNNNLNNNNNNINDDQLGKFGDSYKKTFNDEIDGTSTTSTSTSTSTSSSSPYSTSFISNNNNNISTTSTMMADLPLVKNNTTLPDIDDWSDDD